MATPAPRAPGIPGETASDAMAISEITAAAKDVIEGAFQRLWVKGEVSGFKRYASGHWYFTLKDAAAQLQCVVWKGNTMRIPAAPDEGMAVVARGQLTVWPAQGKMQFVVDALEGEGEGLWKKAFDETKLRLDKEGLTDPARKRRLPRYPRTVAVVTSPEGAAIRDVISVIRRRNPGVSILIVPAAVQGEGAPDSLVAALGRFARWQALAPAKADLLIIGRGGGSREDLWCFNHEEVARAIAACPVPTISAVGHETDFSIADLVADVRAATPSVAAETAVPVLAEIERELEQRLGHFCDALEDRVLGGKRELHRRAEGLALRAQRLTERRRGRVQQVAARIEALSPVAVLARGFSVARALDGRALSRREHFSPGTPFDLLVLDGRVRATADTLHADAPHLPDGSAR